MLELKKIKNSDEKEIEERIKKYSWKDFEKIVADVFITNDFWVKRNLVFKTKRRYEIDIIAKRLNVMFCVDCKSWNRGRYKRSGLAKAAILQEERIREMKKFLSKNLVLKDKLKLDEKMKVIPLIVTLFEEDLVKYSKTIFVPFWKLNSFLQKLEYYI
jgi:Holliday junction resolvase-like predicted endonuclease